VCPARGRRLTRSAPDTTQRHDEALVAEGQQILERAAAARQHEHVDLGLVAQTP
jgi:hypothetical protein